MVEVPMPTMVTTFLEIVATSVFELVYVIGPLLLVVGGIRVNGAFPNSFAGTDKFDIVFSDLPTTREAVITPDVLFDVLD